MQNQKSVRRAVDQWLIKNGLYHHKRSGNLIPLMPVNKDVSALAETFGTDEKSVIQKTVSETR